MRALVGRLRPDVVAGMIPRGARDMNRLIRRFCDAAPSLRDPYVQCSGLRRLSIGSASPASATAQGLNANSGIGRSSPPASVRRWSNGFLLTVEAVDGAHRALPPQHPPPFHAAVQPDPATPQGEWGSRSLNRAERPVAVAEAWRAPWSTGNRRRSRGFRKTP